MGRGAATNGAVTGESEELLLAQTEIRDLKDTIRALRDQLERTNAGRDDAVQSAVAATQEEIRQLREMTRTLRGELEAAVASKEDALQAVRVAALDEARQLRDAITAMRAELEQRRGDRT